MTLMTSSKGITKDIDLDSTALCAYEAEHPGWSILDLMERMKRVRFTDLNLMATFLGYPDYDAWVDDGFDMESMASAVQGSKYLGFTDSPQAVTED